MTTPKENDDEILRRLLAQAEQRALEDQRAIKGQIELDRLAAKCVKPWGKPQPDDYDFRRWAKGAGKELLKAGCIYEYVRESHKLRCLVALMNPARKRMDFELYTSPVTGRQLKRPCSFEGFGEENARDRLGGAFRWLTGFADQLADNKSFAELLRTKQDEVKRSLAGRPLHFSRLKAIELATPFPGDYGPPPWPWQPYSWRLGSPFGRLRLPDRQIGNSGSEKIAIEIRWGDFTNTEIGKEMTKFARAHRPRNENCEDPRRQGQRPQTTIQSCLNALSVMRIWKRFPKAKHLRQRIRQVAKVTDFKGCKDYMMAHRRDFRAGQYDPPTSNAKVEMTKARHRALSYFQSLSPGEKPSNY